MGINVLSLFDGMSCGQIALNRVGIKYDNYFASEIEKYAIKVTQHNYPNTIQLGDVTKIKSCDLPKIDLLIGGYEFPPIDSNFDFTNEEDREIFARNICLGIEKVMGIYPNIHRLK